MEKKRAQAWGINIDPEARVAKDKLIEMGYNMSKLISAFIKEKLAKEETERTSK